MLLLLLSVFKKNKNKSIKNVGSEPSVFAHGGSTAITFQNRVLVVGQRRGELGGLEGVPERHAQPLHLEGAREALRNRAVGGGWSGPGVCRLVPSEDAWRSSTMARWLSLIHVFITLRLVGGSPFQLNMFQGGAYSGAEARQRERNK